MNRFIKSTIFFMALALATTVCAQRTEYIIKEIKGQVEYRLKATDEWQTAKRLLALPMSSTLKVADGASLTVYSRENPQTLCISTPGENKLRKLVTEAQKRAEESRGNALAHVLKGAGTTGQTVRSGTSYRGAEDASMLVTLSEAVKSPSDPQKAPISLALIKDSEGDYELELSNLSDGPLVMGVIVKVNDRYSAVDISGDSSGMLVLPAQSRALVPECKLAGIEGMRVIAVASPEAFSPQTLCVMLNGTAEAHDGAGSGAGAIAVELIPD